jgi:hypothetical protein
MRSNNDADIRGIEQGSLSVISPAVLAKRIIAKCHVELFRGCSAKVRILRFKNLPPFQHDPGLQNRV